MTQYTAHLNGIGYFLTMAKKAKDVGELRTQLDYIEDTLKLLQQKVNIEIGLDSKLSLAQGFKNQMDKEAKS